jgi:hypothetical protein
MRNVKELLVMKVEQMFLRGNKGEVIIVRFQLTSFDSFNFLQNYFINKYQVEFYQDLKIGLHDITDILDRVDRVLENNELAIELLPTLESLDFGNKEYNDLYFNELKEVKTSLTKVKNEWDNDNENYLFSSVPYSF